MPKGDFPAFPLEPSQALALTRAPNTRRRSGMRDRAFLTVLWRCGLRNEEARSLQVSHIVHEPERVVRVMNPKGSLRGKPPRNVGLDDQTWERIQEWLAVRGDHAGFLFDTESGKKLDGKNMRLMIGRRAKTAGIDRRVHPHCLRHTYASELYHEGVGMVDIMNQLGHSSLQTTATYLQRIGCSESVVITRARRFRE